MLYLILLKLLFKHVIGILQSLFSTKVWVSDMSFVCTMHLNLDSPCFKCLETHVAAM